MATDEDVRRIALSLPETSEGPLYGMPGFRVKKKAFTRLRDGGAVLAAWVADEEEKEALIPIEPEVFFTLSHHDGHPSVLVRLAAIDIAALREVTVDPWRARAMATAGDLRCQPQVRRSGVSVRLSDGEPSLSQTNHSRARSSASIRRGAEAGGPVCKGRVVLAGFETKMPINCGLIGSSNSCRASGAKTAQETPLLVAAIQCDSRPTKSLYV